MPFHKFPFVFGLSTKHAVFTGLLSTREIELKDFIATLAVCGVCAAVWCVFCRVCFPVRCNTTTTHLKPQWISQSWINTFLAQTIKYYKLNKTSPINALFIVGLCHYILQIFMLWVHVMSSLQKHHSTFGHNKFNGNGKSEKSHFHWGIVSKIMNESFFDFPKTKSLSLPFCCK